MVCFARFFTRGDDLLRDCRVGPIVRIRPNEVHVADPEFHEKLYTNTARLEKDPWYYRLINSPDAAFGTIDHAHHRTRRSAMDKYFSRRSIERFEPFLRSIVQKLCNRIQEKGEAGLPVDFSAAYRSLASDAVSEFSFPRSFDFVGSPDFAKDFHDTLRELGGLAIWHRHLGFVLQLFTAMPRWLAGLANPRALAVIDYQQVFQHLSA